jgi:hypothetical protein
LAAAVAAVFIAGFSAAAAADVPSRAVRKVDGDEKPAGRIVGHIKLPERPKLKLPEGVVVEVGAKLPEVRLKSVSLLVWTSRDPIAEAEIDDEGRFSFENVPAGVVRLQPNFEVVSPKTEAVARTFSLGQSFTPYTTVQTGETTEVAFFGRGRPVTGKIELPEGIKPKDASVRLTMVDPPSRAMYGRLNRPRPTPLAVAFARVKPDRELESQPLDADSRFRVEGVPEGRYRLHVTIRGQKEPTQVWFRGYAAGQSEWVKNGMFDVPLMTNGTSDVPLDLGAPRFELLPKAG